MDKLSQNIYKNLLLVFVFCFTLYLLYEIRYFSYANIPMEYIDFSPFSMIGWSIDNILIFIYFALCFLILSFRKNFEGNVVTFLLTIFVSSLPLALFEGLFLPRGSTPPLTMIFWIVFLFVYPFFIYKQQFQPRIIPNRAYWSESIHLHPMEFVKRFWLQFFLAILLIWDVSGISAHNKIEGLEKPRTLISKGSGRYLIYRKQSDRIICIRYNGTRQKNGPSILVIPKTENINIIVNNP